MAELTAVRIALNAIRRPELPVRLHTDSTYVIGVLQEGHRTKANAALIADIRREMARFADVQFVKVPAHAGHVENERVDALARACLRPGSGPERT
ncbi:MAG: RNase H family protein [Planctomycetota bacterium]